jgi:hypothetical protein
MIMLYPKIESPFKRSIDGPDRNKLIIGEWAREEFRLLRDLPWQWTEKVDGTNVRVIWDGYQVSFGGRTDNAQMPIFLLDTLRKMFPEELMEQQFGKNQAVLYGEGYGARIQKGGGNYRPDPGFVLFDVLVGQWWLLRDGLHEVALSLGIDLVPLFCTGSVDTAITMVTKGLTSSWGSFPAEGLVGKPPMGIVARNGDRLLMKIKAKDFRSSQETGQTS